MAIVHPGMKPCRNCGDYVLDNDTDLDEAEASYDDFYSDGSPYRDADVCVPCHVHELGTDGYSADDCGCTDCQINQEQDMNTTEKITDRVETYQQARGAMLTDDHTIKPGNRQDRVDRLLDHLRPTPPTWCRSWPGSSASTSRLLRTGRRPSTLTERPCGPTCCPS